MLEPQAGLPARLVWGVSALVQAAADALAARFPVCAVRGEISGFSRAASGHCYFNLKDADGGTALIRCAMFRRAASLLDFRPADGQQVELRGRLGVYESRSELQLVVEGMQPAGAGSLYEQFLRLKARLADEGLFDPQRKRALPSHPRRLGIVASLASAALHDVMVTLSRRAPHVQLIVYPSVVQGETSPLALTDALGLAARRREVDALLLCRGGGSLEDLWAFNDERVVRAIVGMPMPVVCGVGHETDVTLADFAADVRAATPTAAAELAAPARQDCLDRLDVHAQRLHRRVQGALDAQSQRLDGLGARLARPADLVRRHGHRLDLLAHRLRAAARAGVVGRSGGVQELQARLRRAALGLAANRSQRLDLLDARLQALDPQRVLARGYAWLSDASGVPLLSVHSLHPGDRLRAVLHDGAATVAVEQVEPGASA